MTNARPHHAFWPPRLPRELVIPETTLWFNAEVSAARYPDKPLYRFFGRDADVRQLKRQAESAGRLAAARSAWRRATGSALFMQNCPQFAVAYYGILRADAVVVPVNPMNRAEEFEHYITDPGAKVVITTADLAAIVAAANDALPPDSAPDAAAGHALCRRDARSATLIPAGDEPPPAMAEWLYAEHPLPAGATRWNDVLAPALQARPAHGAARRPGGAAVHLGHHRAAQGLHAHASHADAQRDRRQPVGPGQRRNGVARRGADVPHHRHDVRACMRRSGAAPPWC